MAVLKCGDCGRMDFEEFDELLDHDCSERPDDEDDDPEGGAAPELIADGGDDTTTIDECGECGAILDEGDIVVTQDAQLACPCCGEVLTTKAASVNELLYASNSGHSGADRKFHLSRDCRYLQRANDVHTCSVDHPPRGSLCSHCASGITLDELATNAATAGGGA
jgi:DNA-directed RNA polymerase subunit RPC12/RpoP